MSVSVPHGRKTEGGASAPPTATEIAHGVRAKPTFKTARDICAEATRLVGGDRATLHGDKRANFQNIACLWNSWLSMTRATRGVEATYLSARDVGDLMELLKIARRHSGSYNPDDYIDAAGYAGCAGEIAHADQLSSERPSDHGEAAAPPPRDGRGGLVSRYVLAPRRRTTTQSRLSHER